MVKNKYNFIIKSSKTSYSFLLHQCLISINFLQSIFLHNNLIFSRFVFHYSFSFVLICFSFTELLSNPNLFFYFLEKHLSFSVFNNVPVKIFSKSLNSIRTKFSAFSFALLLKKALEMNPQLDSVLFDISFLLRSHFKPLSQNLKGVFIQLKGRLNGSDRSKKKVVVFGKGSRSLNHEKVAFSFVEAFTKHGTVGVKIWVFF